MLVLVETIAVSRYGEIARFTKPERDAIEPNLAKILNSMSPKTAQKLGAFSAPLAVFGGLFSYGMRVSAAAAKALPDGVRVARPVPVVGVPQSQPVSQEPGRTYFSPASNPSVDSDGHINRRAS